LPDKVLEADEMYQNAGEKGILHLNFDDPPRRRANKRRGHGTFENDRPPIAGLVGRESGQIRLRVLKHSDRQELEPFVVGKSVRPVTVNTDEWQAYNHLPAAGRAHKSVNHTPGQREWARDDDGDGIREVHCNTLEGIWTGLRNFLRPFRGVSKHFLSAYVAVFEWTYNLKELTIGLLQAMVLRTLEAT
jgi:transposase-like protein